MRAASLGYSILRVSHTPIRLESPLRLGASATWEPMRPDGEILRLKSETEGPCSTASGRPGKGAPQGSPATIYGLV